jgi:Trk-type K+ transport system membrane component
MYGINTEYQIPYIDCLFLCVSSMTVNGLATVDLSTLSVMQQVIMFWQMLIGSLVCPLSSLHIKLEREGWTDFRSLYQSS